MARCRWGNSSVNTIEAARKIRWDKHYEPNMEHLRGVDHALQSVLGVGLVAFGAKRMPRPLEDYEQRYTVGASDLPDSLCRGLGFASRPCIRDTRTGQSRLELIWTDRKFLIEALDCGSIGWPSKFWVASAAGLRSAFLADPCHLRYNRLMGAVKSSGL